ncbi:prepilin-type N-terminal cleavage/methylation domain-containing protein [bacterium]|nr:prepilin-type N-terminal cleavage/methylation domain-containing protein [bacterium]
MNRNSNVMDLLDRGVQNRTSEFPPNQFQSTPPHRPPGLPVIPLLDRGIQNRTSRSPLPVIPDSSLVSLKRHRAFTLVEMLIVISLISVFSISVYALYTAGIRSFNMSANKSEALQASYFLYQKLMYEFKMAISNETHPVLIESTEGGTNNRLSFYIYSRDPNQPAQILTDPVIYEFFPDEFLVRRNGKNLPDKFSLVEFIYEQPDLASAPAGVHKLFLRITGIGRQSYLALKGGSQDARIERDQVTLSGGFAIAYKTVGEAFPTWFLNASSLPQ